MKSGGHFGCWTMKAVNKYLAAVTTDTAVEQLPRGGYVCKDRFTGNHGTGRTPAEAARSVIAYLPPDCNGYN